MSFEKTDTPFDLVIVDLTVTGGTGGVDTAEQILNYNPDAKIIVSSGYSKDAELSKYAQFGFVDVLKKPYHMDDLIKITEKWTV